MTLPGEVIDVAGERLHVVVDGPDSGPPLLLSSGLGGAWFDWQPTVDLLRDRFRIVNFDRPGLGGSPQQWAAPTLNAETDRLAALARWAASSQPTSTRRPPRTPVLVAAHSYAAFHAEALARTHPELVSGVVLVDPSCEANARIRVRLSPVLTPLVRVVGVLAGVTGAARLLGPWTRSLFMRKISHRDAAPPAVVRAVYGRGAVAGTSLAENVAYGEMAADLVRLRRARPFPEIPLTVLTALGDVRSSGGRRDWVECHRRLASMTPYGRQIVLDGARHLLQTDRPEAVADAVAEIGSRA